MLTARRSSNASGLEARSAHLTGAIARAGLLLLMAVFALGGCGGAGTESVPVGAGGGTTTATGVDDPDVQAFRINLWSNLQVAGRCSQCHTRGIQSPYFADREVATAYDAAVQLINRTNPGASRLVAKVGTGHGCWNTDVGVCTDQMTGWIDRWVNGTGSGGVTQIELTPPPIQPVGDSQGFVDDGGDRFRQFLHGPIFRRDAQDYCSRCHSGDARVPQQPFFAAPSDSDGSYQTAYDEAKPKIDLNNPGNSRFVLRMREGHNCWTDCDTAAQEMQAAIEAFIAAGGAETTTVDAGLPVSAMLQMGDGTEVSGGARVEAGVIAKYDFSNGSGSTVFDRSGIDPALDLTLSDTDLWVGGFGVRFSDPTHKAQGTTTSSAKLRREISNTGEYSIEAWVIPANVVQEEANIVSYSGSDMERNFTLGQTLYNYDFFNRTTASGADANASAALSTADADERLQATLQHVVLTFDPVEGRKVYVNGEYTQDLDPDAGAEIVGWDDGYAFVLGNEVDGQRPWAGTLRLVAIFSRALTPVEIQQNFDAGVGQKFYLLFNIGALLEPGVTPIPQHYIMLEVSEFDEEGYLFNTPTFVSLDPSYVPNFQVQGMRIGINGKEAAVGQVYPNLDVQVSQPNQLLSPLGAVIAKEQGRELDEFFLSFDSIAGIDNVVIRAQATRQPPPADTTPRSLIGIRTFEEINATMSVVTGVDPENPEVEATYLTIKQQLPTVEDIEGFLSSHQVAISQLAIEYCDKLVENPSLRSSFFGSFAFDSAVATAFPDDAAKNQIIDALYDRIVAVPNASTTLELDNVPTRAEVRLELSNPPDGLFDRLVATCATDSCDLNGARTKTVVKAMCAATLGSANMLIQ